MLRCQLTDFFAEVTVCDYLLGRLSACSCVVYSPIFLSIQKQTILYWVITWQGACFSANETVTGISTHNCKYLSHL